MKCPLCNSEKISKLTVLPTLKGKKQRYRCNECGKSWTEGVPISFHKYNTTKKCETEIERVRYASSVVGVERLMENSLVGRRARLMELAGMLKEKGEGSIKDINEILIKLSLLTGIKKETALQYYEMLKEAGIIIPIQGNLKWKYNENAELDFFKINVEI